MEKKSGSSDGTIGPREKAVLITLVKFTLGMILVPLGAFFVCKGIIFEGILGYSNGAIGSAVVTVIIIHVIIFMYVRIAINEDQEPVEKKKE
ncbi:vacuolar ATPase assembly integral membrane protein Vma21 [Nematostella vectensis]|uniref:vacuolar ATPase assembly integral membrane protein Vma21 n=1 Tax=Nematostella vectensis TaxID=45351 RepID=UPI00138FFD24|nr:vacuolar ATPase assembly integral membrane protein Vma21 [Nematostella vectensis]